MGSVLLYMRTLFSPFLYSVMSAYVFGAIATDGSHLAQPKRTLKFVAMRGVVTLT